MLNVGDYVKVISKTRDLFEPEQMTEYIPIGTICIVSLVDYDSYGIKPLNSNDICFYNENELEKGHVEWIKDTDDLNVVCGIIVNESNKVDGIKGYCGIMDGITTCCGYDFGVDMSEAKYCPICGGKLTKK